MHLHLHLLLLGIVLLAVCSLLWCAACPFKDPSSGIQSLSLLILICIPTLVPTLDVQDHRCGQEQA